MHENSGPRMRAWVRIPLLTKTFFNSFANHTFLENDYLDIIPKSQKYTPILPLCKLLLEFIEQKKFYYNGTIIWCIFDLAIELCIEKYIHDEILRSRRATLFLNPSDQNYILSKQIFIL